jgi:GMP synthase-like glutamine amidotransferase
MRVHYLQHVHFEGLGHIEPWLLEHGHSLSGTGFFEREVSLPAPASFDALIIMGGPMSIYDEVEHPWLAREKTFIKECLEADKKILGICLGAQLLAHCLGARVHPAPHKEIGWFPVSPIDGQSWLPGLFRSNPTVFHWHGDQFDIPPGAEGVLRSEANDNQAFWLNARVMGLQFHLEVTDALLGQMLAHGADELVPAAYVEAESAIRSGSRHAPAGHRLMGAILGAWLEGIYL